jgi:hypothetical protein
VESGSDGITINRAVRTVHVGQEYVPGSMAVFGT